MEHNCITLVLISNICLRGLEISVLVPDLSLISGVSDLGLLWIQGMKARVALKSTCLPLNAASLHYLFIAFIFIFNMPIGHVNLKSTSASQKPTCPRRLGNYLFAPWSGMPKHRFLMYGDFFSYSR